MSGSNTNNTSWREEDVEAVLRDFLHAEMPADLRDLTPSANVVVTSANRTEQPGGNPQTGRFSVVASVAVLCVAVSIVLTSFSSFPETRNQPSSESGTSVADTVPVKKSHIASGAASKGPNSRWNGSVIPVEMREFADGVLVELGILDPEPLFFPDLRVDPIREDNDEEGKSTPPKSPKNN